MLFAFLVFADENFLLCGNEKFISLCEGLYEEFKEDKNTQILVGYVQIILGEALKSLKPLNKAETISSDLFSEVLKYISVHYKEKITLQETSERFGISAEHLSRTFSKKLACPFTKYLHFLRVEEAKNLLTLSGKSVLEVAFESGFSDQRTFNRVFKEFTSLTPAEYRRTYQRKNP